jgi:hypothetical protein
MTGFRVYTVNRSSKKPLLRFILGSLEQCGCTVLKHSEPDRAPFRITFESPTGERIGIIAYGFLANSKPTRNRPADEHRFQVKYGPKPSGPQELWQDPFRLYTTLFFGIHLERNVFVGVDPVLHNPTRFFISIEFKEENVREIEAKGWTWWERQKRSQGLEEPVEIMVGGRPDAFLKYIELERVAAGMDQGHRALVADKVGTMRHRAVMLSGTDVHPLSEEFQLSRDEILNLMLQAPRLKTAVRGWVAEKHLLTYLTSFPEITECTAIETDGQADLRVTFRDRPVLVECKNILRRVYSDQIPRVDFQKTRASKTDPCSRYYKYDDFDMVAACLHPRTEKWEFSFARAGDLDFHPKCPGRLSNNVRLDDRWSSNPLTVLEMITKGPLKSP